MQKSIAVDDDNEWDLVLPRNFRACLQAAKMSDMHRIESARGDDASSELWHGQKLIWM
jgi:hypothetical protein